MRYNFLYTKSKNTVGYLDGHESPEDSLWFMSEDYTGLVEHFNKCNLDQYIVKLVEIFENGSPSYSRLGEVLGNDINQSNNSFSVNKVNREKEDIERIIFEMNDDFEITSLHLHLRKPSFLFDSLQDRLADQNIFPIIQGENINIDVNNVNICVASMQQGLNSVHKL